MSWSADWDLQIDPAVFKNLKKLPRHDVEAILDVIKVLPFNPYFGDIQKMKSETDTWRRRVGAYRIFYRIKILEKVILVFHVERRTSKTY